MGVSIKQLYGTKTLAEKEEEDRFWEKWYEAKNPRVYNDRGHWNTLDLSTDEALQVFVGDDVRLEHIPILGRLLKEDGSLTDEDRAMIETLIQAVEADALQTTAPTDKQQPVETTASPQDELQQARATIQAQQARITELENDNEYLRANQRKQKKGVQQRGTLGLKACQRIGAFAILLELITGKEVNVLQEDGGQNIPLKTLYSEVTSTDVETATADISKLQDSNHEIRTYLKGKIRTELTSLLNSMGIALGE